MHTVAIIFDSFHWNEAVGHVPLYWSELTNKCLKLRVIVTGKRVNWGTGLELEIPVDYCFHGDNRVNKCFKKSMKKFTKCTDVKVKKMHETTYEICLLKK